VPRVTERPMLLNLRWFGRGENMPADIQHVALHARFEGKENSGSPGLR